MTCDTAAVAKRLDQSREQYLSALDAYRASGAHDNGAAIIEDYLIEFTKDDPDRGPFDKEHAREAIKIIDKFNIHLAELTAMVGNHSRKFAVTMNALSLAFLSRTTDIMAESADCDPAASDLKRAKAEIASMQSGRAELEQLKEQMECEAATAGLAFCKLAESGAFIIDNRRLIINGFKQRNLDTTWEDWKNRTRTFLRGSSREEISSAVWDGFLELIEVIFEIGEEETVPIKRIKGHLERILEVFGVHKKHTTTGGGAKMQHLLKDLIAQIDEIDNLRALYNQTMGDLDALTARAENPDQFMNAP